MFALAIQPPCQIKFVNKFGVLPELICHRSLRQRFQLTFGISIWAMIERVIPSAIGDRNPDPLLL